MSAETSKSDPIELLQLQEAAAVVPPDVVKARAAVIAIGELLHTASTKERGAIVLRTAELTADIAEAYVAHDADGSDATVDEFSGYTNAYSAMASIMNLTESVQVEPTQTAGKDLTGGKS